MTEIQETASAKRDNLIGYRMVDGVYQLYDFETNETLDTMEEVSFLYDGDTLLKHGSPQEIGQCLEKLVDTFVSVELASLADSMHIIQGKLSIEEIDKMLSITGYLPKTNGLQSTFTTE